MGFTDLTFSPTTGWNDTTLFPTTPESETDVRERLQELHDQTRIAFNGLIDELERVTDGSSGADCIGVTAIAGWAGASIQAILESAKTAFDNLVAGEIDPSTILTTGAINATTMFADDVVTGEKIAADTIDSEHYAAGSIDAEHLAGASVTETKIDSGAVTVNKIGTGAVALAKLATDALARFAYRGTLTEVDTVSASGIYVVTTVFNGMLIHMAWSAGQTETQIRNVVGASYFEYRVRSSGTWGNWKYMGAPLYGTSASPPAGSYPAGTLYVQHEA